jgi:N-acetylmuramoyl-L-alanine amidase
MRRRALVAGLVAGAALRPAGLRAAPAQQLSGRTIVLDPGHGGPDPGARARDGAAVEAFVNLEVALRLRRLLEASGARVVMTRETDARPMAPGAREAPAGERQDLEARVQIANAARADLFVSLHADVLPDPERGGTLVFWGPPSGYTYPRERPGELVRRSTEAAQAVLWHLVAKTGLHERGAAPEAFYVLGSTAMPAILVEMAVLTNPAEGIFLTGEGFQQRLAEGLADGIADFFGERHDAELAADVTIPDGAIVAPGTTLQKVWRVRNSGGATWGSGYRLAAYAGDRLDGPGEVPVPGPVAPGATVDLGVALRTPPGERGWLFSQWRMRTPTGVWFGQPLWLLVMSRGPRPTDPAPPVPGARYFAETGHNVGGAFREAFEGYGAAVAAVRDAAASGAADAAVAGGVRLFGYPRTEELQEGGRTVQYFQRARFEWHPERGGTPDEVRLAPLGESVTTGQGPFAGVPLPEAGSEAPADGASPGGGRVLPDPHQPGVGHVVRGAFLDFYAATGGDRLFGPPLTEEVPWAEPGATPEGSRTVQVFQNAQLEYDPTRAGTPEAVQLALLGDEVLRRRGWLDPPSPIGRIP